MNEHDLLIQRFLDQNLSPEERVAFLQAVDNDSVLRRQLLNLEMVVAEAAKDGYTWTSGAPKDLGSYKILGMVDTTVQDWNLYLHLAPLAFSNFFLLHKDNIRYYEMTMSVLNPDVTKIVWDEYFMSKGERPRDDGKKKGWFSVLMNTKNEVGDKPFRAAFWILIALLLLYVLMEMRRKQRIIPVVVKPRNDSLEVVKTIGRLYYDKGNHKNLCRKMPAFFQEHVRMKYKLPTGNMNEEFIHALQYKSGVPDYEIRGVVSFIKYLDDAATVSDTQLSEFYKELESFYKKA